MTSFASQLWRAFAHRHFGSKRAKPAPLMVHSISAEMQKLPMAKEFSNQLCMTEGLSITEAKANRYDQPQWKKKLKAQIKKALEFSYDKAEFIKIMEIHGYKVKWEDEHKYITFTTPEGYVCRDNKLFDNTLLRKNLELYFEMGGMEYYQNRENLLGGSGVVAMELEQISEQEAKIEQKNQKTPKITKKCPRLTN